MLTIPSVVYVVQNNLLYFSLSNLDAVVYQVCYQLKILTTAVFSITMLGRSLSCMKWTALFILTVGVALVQTSSMASGDKKSADNAFLGFVAVLSACFTSGFSGVFFERVLKGSSTSLWIRNIQMGLSSITIALISAFANDGDEIRRVGFFFGYNRVVLMVIFLQAIGGLTVAVVVNYADNILKGFAASYSIVCSLIVEMMFFKFELTFQFVLGAILVNLATYVYSRPDRVAHVLP